MTLDETSHSVIVVFRNPARLAVVDMITGKVSLTADTCNEAGGVSWDAKRSRIYVSCGSGSIDVFKRTVTALERLERIGTPSGAQASLFAPELERFYLAVSAIPHSQAAPKVYRASP